MVFVVDEVVVVVVVVSWHLGPLFNLKGVAYNFVEWRIVYIGGGSCGCSLVSLFLSLCKRHIKCIYNHNHPPLNVPISWCRKLMPWVWLLMLMCTLREFHAKVWGESWGGTHFNVMICTLQVWVKKNVGLVDCGD